MPRLLPAVLLQAWLRCREGPHGVDRDRAPGDLESALAAAR